VLLILAVAFTAPPIRHLGDSLPYAALPSPGREIVDGAPGESLQL
jgi:hypothetical protein